MPYWRAASSMRAPCLFLFPRPGVRCDSFNVVRGAHAMKRNPFFRLLARLRVGRKLLLIYLLDLSAVVYISGILIHEKYISIDFSNKEIIGNAYIGTVRDALIDVAMTGAGQRPPVARLNDAQADLVKTEAEFGAHLQSADLNARVRAALGVLAREAQPTPAEINEALDACRELVT